MLYFDPEFGLELRQYKGGGGSSGKVEYPDYLENIHKDLMKSDGDGLITTSMFDVINAGVGSSPFTGETPFDPDTDIAAWLAGVDQYGGMVDLLSSGTPLNTLISNIMDSSRIDDEVTAFGDSLSDKLTSDIYPKFEAGMRSINAVQSSAFVIGRALIEDSRLRELSKFEANVRFKTYGDDALKLVGMKLEHEKILSAVILDARKLKIVAKMEEHASVLDIEEKDARWDMEIFQYSANLVAAPGGGTAVTASQKMSRTQSTMAGAASGAAAGGSTGTWAGLIIGAVAGGVAGYYSA